MKLTDEIRAGYDTLALTQLEELKKDYEPRLSEGRSRAETSKQEVVQKAVTSKIQEIRSEQEKLGEENKALMEHNRILSDNIRMMQKSVEEIKKRKTMSLKSKQGEIRDLTKEVFLKLKYNINCVWCVDNSMSCRP
ncbi:hypothetical protein ACJRO7_005069 [Eucalyptus globulus]|uniref:Uncharacterized protein n=1 Tax=Eucalyptus globulus TaxID=34317 RepID=A0ABD3IYF7_EUCGL